jgi:PBSX family phage terminase large subunit
MLCCISGSNQEINQSHLNKNIYDIGVPVYHNYVANGLIHHNSGKSRILCYAAFREATKKHNEVLLIRKTLVSLKKSTLISLIGGPDPVLPKGCYNFNKGENTIEVVGGGVIHLMGMDEPTRIRSMNLGCVCVDEAIEFNEEEYLEFTYRMRNQYGNRQIYLATNPGAPNADSWIYKRFFIDKNDKREVITATSFENYHLPQDYFDSFNDLDPQRKKRMLEGQWVAFDNLVFPNFNRSKQVQPLLKTGFESYYFAIDWGQTHPCAMMLAGVTDGHIAVISEFVERDMLIDKVRAIIKSIYTRYNNLCLLYDPSAKMLQNDLANIGIELKKANNDVAVGINRVRNRLDNGSLLINSDCTNFVRELENYQFKPGTEQVKKVGDDLCDCCRYIVNEIDDAQGGFIYPTMLDSAEEEPDAEEQWEEIPFESGIGVQ